MKYTIVWFLTAAATGYVLFNLTSVLSQITVNPIREFEILLMLFGFSATVSTLVTSVIYLKERINPPNKKP